MDRGRIDWSWVPKLRNDYLLDVYRVLQDGTLQEHVEEILEERGILNEVMCEECGLYAAVADGICNECCEDRICWDSFDAWWGV